jgi:hypothetical protein
LSVRQRCAKTTISTFENILLLMLPLLLLSLGQLSLSPLSLLTPRNPLALLLVV